MIKGGFKAHVILMTTTVIGGFNYSVSKIVMPDYVQPSAIIIIRGIFAILFFWLLHLLFVKEKLSERKDLYRMFVCAIFGITANQILFYEGLNLTTPINASLLQCAVPIFVIIFSAWMLQERITAIKILGITLGATGAILLLLHSRRAELSGAQAGDIMVLLNAISYAVFLVLVRPLSQKYNPITIVKWVFLFGTIMSLPFGYNQLMKVEWSRLPQDAIISLGFIIIFATLINYYLNVGVLRFVQTSVAGIYIYLQPVIASVIAISMEKDSFTYEKIFYSLLIFGGVYLVSKKNI
jgi:drug/metabolite transporter (DMT)-like permease